MAHRHAGVLAGFPDVELVAAVDVDPDRAEAFAAEYGLRAVPDLDAFLDEDLDAAYVCVPPFAHGVAEVRVAAAGVALFVEKPLAADEATAEWVSRRIRTSGVLTRVGHHWRCAEPVQKARELLAGRRVRLVSGAWLDKAPPVPWWVDRVRSGGPIVEQAVHVLDLARVLVGEVTEVHAASAGALPGGAETATGALLCFADGAVGTLGTANVLGGKHRAGLEIVADGLVVGVGEDWLEVRTGSDGTVRTEYTAMAPRTAVDRAFVDAVRGRPLPANRDAPDHTEAMRSHRLACALARSVISGRPEPVRLDARPIGGTVSMFRVSTSPASIPAESIPAESIPAESIPPGPRSLERAIVVESPGVAAVCEVPASEGPLALATVCTGISAGTELSFLTGRHPALHSGLDPELALFRPDRPGAGYPITRLGYMEVARVMADDDGAGPPPGAFVAATYGHRTHYRLDPLAERLIVLPDNLDPLLGIYVAHMGPICANGLLHAAADLCGTDVRSLGDGVRGRRVAVVGAGVVGLLTALFARLHGAAEVVVLDPTTARRAAVAGLGFEALDPDDGDPAVRLKTRWRHGPGDRGADVVFQCRGRTAALGAALRLLRPQGTVVDLAFYTDDGAGLRLGAEFHHNALTVRCAQIGRVPRGTTHAWDRERLSAETIDLLRTEGPAVREHMITDVVPFEEGPALLADLAARRRHVIQAVLTIDG